MQPWLLCLVLASRPGPRPLLRAERPSFLKLKAADAQPVRCAISVCKPFESACSSNGECVTDKCYNGKCGLGATCAPEGERCSTDGAHTCCTGVCNPVQIRSDCMRLLNIDKADLVAQAEHGVNVDRQCEHLGVCSNWPGESTGPSTLTEPWAVNPSDNPAKYYALSSMTFRPGTQVNVAQTVARKIGSITAGVSPKATKPRAVLDAGIMKFLPGSRVARELHMEYKAGADTFCVAPILLEGEGGAYYAVGKDCCADGEFACGDPEADFAPAGVVVTSDLGQFAQTRELLEVQYGIQYHDDKRGVKTDAPVYLWWSKDPETEQLKTVTSSGLTYVVPVDSTTWCTAPIGDGHGFFAVGTDCCETGLSFTCGPAQGNPDAHSGSLVVDLTGDYTQAVKQGEFLFGYTANPKPIYLNWTATVLVTAPA